MKIKVLIADDNKLFREILALRFRETIDLEVIALAEDGLVVLEKIEETKPDVILMDIRMPRLNGIETTIALHKKYPEIKVIAVTTFTENLYIKGMLEANAWGYMLKDSSYEQLVEAIKQVYAGKKYFSSEVEGIILKDFLGQTSQETKKLTKREAEILKLLAEGKSIREISESLFVSIKTVGTHKQNIFEKLEFENMAQLFKFALNNGIVS